MSPTGSGSGPVFSVYGEIGAKTEGFKNGVAEVIGGMGGLVGAITKGVMAGNLALQGLEKGIDLIREVLIDSISAAAEAETSFVRLSAALTATGRSAEISAGSIRETAESLMQMSSFSHEEIENAYTALTQFENVPTEQMEAITKAAMDMTAAMGGDLAGNAEVIGRVLETGVIPRTFGFSAALKEQIRQMIESGDQAGALSMMLDKLNARYGGQSLAQLTTYAGATKALNNSMEDAAETIGEDYLPALTMMKLIMADVVDLTTQEILVRQHSDQLGDLSRRSTGDLISTRNRLNDSIDEGNLKSENAMIISSRMKIEAELAARGITEYGDSAKYTAEQLNAMGTVKIPDNLELPENLLTNPFGNWKIDTAAVVVPLQSAEDAAKELQNRFSELQLIISGELGKSTEDYQARIADLRKQLKEEPSRKGKAEIREQIEEVTAAYQRQTMEIIYNTQAQIINASSLKPDQQLAALTALAQGYGLMDAATATLVSNTNAVTTAFLAGGMSIQEYSLLVKGAGELSAGVTGNAKVEAENFGAAQTVMGHGVEEGAGAVRTAADAYAVWTQGVQDARAEADKGAVTTGGAAVAVDNTGKAAETALPKLDKFTGGMSRLEGSSSEARIELGMIIGHMESLDGMHATAYVTIVTNGSFPSFAQDLAKPSEGFTHGGHSGEYASAGKQLDTRGWTLVGDMPGGQLTPFSELISPWGEVFNAEATRKLVRTGLLDFQSAYEEEGWGNAIFGNFTSKPSKHERHVATPVLVSKGSGDSATSNASSVVSQAVQQAVEPTMIRTGMQADAGVTQQRIAANAAMQQVAATQQNTTAVTDLLRQVLEGINNLPSADDNFRTFRDALQQGGQL